MNNNDLQETPFVDVEGFKDDGYIERNTQKEWFIIVELMIILIHGTSLTHEIINLNFKSQF